MLNEADAERVEQLHISREASGTVAPKRISE